MAELEILVEHPAFKKVAEELACPICLETAQLPVNFLCFRGCGGRFSAGSTCLRSVLCLHCANEALQLGRPPPARFHESGGFAYCLICRETRVDARMLTPDNAYTLNHNVMAIMDALGMGATCRSCGEACASQSSLQQHYLRRCPGAVVRCRFRGCAHWHPRHAAALHEDTCPVGRAPCGQCGSWLDRTDLLRHMVTTCRLRVVSCVLCRHSAPLPEMLQHLRLHQSQLLQGQVRVQVQGGHSAGGPTAAAQAAQGVTTAQCRGQGQGAQAASAVQGAQGQGLQVQTARGALAAAGHGHEQGGHGTSAPALAAGWPGVLAPGGTHPPGPSVGPRGAVAPVAGDGVAASPLLPVFVGARAPAVGHGQISPMLPTATPAVAATTAGMPVNGSLVTAEAVTAALQQQQHPLEQRETLREADWPQLQRSLQTLQQQQALTPTQAQSHQHHRHHHQQQQQQQQRPHHNHRHQQPQQPVLMPQAVHQQAQRLLQQMLLRQQQLLLLRLQEQARARGQGRQGQGEEQNEASAPGGGDAPAAGAGGEATAEPALTLTPTPRPGQEPRQQQQQQQQEQAEPRQFAAVHPLSHFQQQQQQPQLQAQSQPGRRGSDGGSGGGDMTGPWAAAAALQLVRAGAGAVGFSSTISNPAATTPGPHASPGTAAASSFHVGAVPVAAPSPPRLRGRASVPGLTQNDEAPRQLRSFAIEFDSSPGGSEGGGGGGGDAGLWRQAANGLSWPLEPGLRRANVSAPGYHRARWYGSTNGGGNGGSGRQAHAEDFNDTVRRRGSFWPPELDDTLRPDHSGGVGRVTGGRSDSGGRRAGEDADQGAVAAAVAADEAARLVRTAAAIVRASAAASERRSRGHRQAFLGGSPGLWWGLTAGRQSAGPAPPPTPPPPLGTSAAPMRVAAAPGGGLAALGLELAETEPCGLATGRGDGGGGGDPKQFLAPGDLAGATGIGAGASSPLAGGRDRGREVSAASPSSTRSVMSHGANIRRSLSDTELVFDVLEELVRASSNWGERSTVRVSASGV